MARSQGLTIAELERALDEAEAAYRASNRALMTHGRSALTWKLVRHDALEVRKARAALLIALDRQRLQQD